jgi:hypothetical protein
MKRSCLLVLWISLLSTVLFAQEDTLNTGGSFKFKPYIEPGCKLTSVIGNPALMYGVRLGVVIDSLLSVGLGGYKMGKDMLTDQPSIHEKPIWLNVEYGGLVLEYINQPDKTIHYTVEFLLGGGLSEFKEHNADVELLNDGFFLILGNANLEINVLPWLRFNCGIGQRYVTGIDMVSFSNSDIGGTYLTAGLRFGKIF